MIKMWILGVRHWEIAKDFEYVLNGNKYVMRQVLNLMVQVSQKFLHPFYHHVAYFLIGGLIHDYEHKYEALLRQGNKETMGVITQKKADEIFRDINIGVNGFYLMNYLTYWSLRLGRTVAWNKHRKVNAKIK